MTVSNIDYAYVAVYCERPIAVAHTMEELETMVDDYVGVSKGLSYKLGFKGCSENYPCILDYEGSFMYRDKGEEEIDFYKVYSCQYKSA